jgi:hypothetical protein
MGQQPRALSVIGQYFQQQKRTVFGADILIAVICGMVASLSRPGKVEREAEFVRSRALGQAKMRLLSDVAMPALGIVLPWPRSVFLLQFVLRILLPHWFQRRGPVGFPPRRIDRAA